MTDLVQFLSARLDEEQAAANRSCPPRHPVEGGEVWSVGDEEDFRIWVVTGSEGNDGIAVVNGVARAAHIARHDPARVLREVEAKRRMLEDHTSNGELYEHDCPGRWVGYVDDPDEPCPTLRLLALPYADHPDYREEWRP